MPTSTYAPNVMDLDANCDRGYVDNPVVEKLVEIIHFRGKTVGRKKLLQPLGRMYHTIRGVVVATSVTLNKDV